MNNERKYADLVEEVELLRSQLTEAEDTIDAIRTGAVDAFIVTGKNGHELYTLKSSDLIYRLFIEKMAEGAVTLNNEGYILYCNSSFACMLELSLSEVLGFHFKKFFPPVYTEAVGNLLKKAWQKESRVEISLPRKDGSELPVLLSANKFNIDGDEILGVIATDLSVQRETQKQKTLMEQKDEFISIASHELKTPVTSIKGYVQLLHHHFIEEGNTHAAGLLQKADVQVDKLTMLINDLLDIKKMENGQLQYQEDLFEFDMLAEEIIEQTARVVPMHVIRFRHEKTGTVLGDRNKIGQVIMNFITNAGKYSPAGTEISICTNKKGNNICLTVTDAGIGIPKDKQDKIFERFFRVQNSDRENTYSGLGLGLYISAAIIKHHHGRIGVESEEGKGSAFYFEIPLHQNI